MNLRDLNCTFIAAGVSLVVERRIFITADFPYCQSFHLGDDGGDFGASVQQELLLCNLSSATAAVGVGGILSFSLTNGKGKKCTALTD